MQWNKRQVVQMIEYAKQMPSDPKETPQNPIKPLQKLLGSWME